MDSEVQKLYLQLCKVAYTEGFQKVTSGDKQSGIPSKNGILNMFYCFSRTAVSLNINYVEGFLLLSD
jgi:hypothetical protein